MSKCKSGWSVCRDRSVLDPRTGTWPRGWEEESMSPAWPLLNLTETLPSAVPGHTPWTTGLKGLEHCPGGKLQEQGWLPWAQGHLGAPCSPSGHSEEGTAACTWWGARQGRLEWGRLFRVDIRKKHPHPRRVKQGHRLPWEVVQASSVEVFKAWADWSDLASAPVSAGGFPAGRISHNFRLDALLFDGDSSYFLLLCAFSIPVSCKVSCTTTALVPKPFAAVMVRVAGCTFAVQAFLNNLHISFLIHWPFL